MDATRAFEEVSKVEIEKVRLFLRQEAENRVVEEDGFTLFDCLALNIKTLLLRLPDRNNTGNAHVTTIEDYTSSGFIKRSVVDLLSKHKKQSVLTILVDNFPPEVLPNSQSESKEIEAHLERFYQRVMEDCQKDDKYVPYARLCIYAAATCLNTPIYILCVREAREMEWTYFKPLFTFPGQPASVFRYVTMFLSSDNAFHGVESHDQSARAPVARGLVGMYMSKLKETPETSIVVPPGLLNLRESKKCDIVKGDMVNSEIVRRCCELLKTKTLSKNVDLDKMSAHRAPKTEFAEFVKNSEDAFYILCQVLLKRCDKTFLKLCISNWSDFVGSCDYLAKYDALIDVDRAIYERNIGVSAFVSSCTAGGQELNERRRRITTTVIASSSVGIVSGGMVIAGLVLAPVSFGASLGLSIAGGAIGVGSGVAAGTARTVEAVKQNSKLMDIKAEQAEIQAKEQRISSILQKVEEYFTIEIANSRTTDAEGPGISRRGFLAVGAALRAGHSVAGIALAAVRLGTAATAVAAGILGLCLWYLMLHFWQKQRIINTKVI
ncbi:uncharacterized protein LOC132718859 [Ruditapes philippinarum]|uniref:uncharacterized protein LOC132718859 n=1 Tax=Ruditapes philippinarum TaxID=129788 RepID=UPI00295B5D0A|nr:uncharacterized protein LOC132718859 [Ruditapes philippinarum]